MDGNLMQDAQTLRELTLADEHLMICVCGVDEQDEQARVLEDALKKIVRIKLQMGSNHRIGLARAAGSHVDVVQEFTRNTAQLVAAVPSVLRSEREDDVDLDSILAHAARHFSAHRDTIHQTMVSFRLLLLYRQVNQRPQLHANQSEISQAFISDPNCHLDVIYWHRDVTMEMAQTVFDQLCAYDNTNPFAKFYFLEVGGSVERLHQVLVLALSHPAQRLSQTSADQLLSAWLSQTKDSTL